MENRERVKGMKKLLFFERQTNCFFIGLILAFLFILCGVLPTQAAAPEPALAQTNANDLSEAEEEAKGILQTGGLLQEESSLPEVSSPDGVRPYGADYAGAEQALAQAIENFETRVPMERYGMTVEEYKRFYVAFTNNHPQYFYLASRYGWTYSKSTNQVITARLYYSSDNTEEMKQRIEAYENRVFEIISQVDSTWSDLEKALYINDTIALNCFYDDSLTRHNAYDVLVDGTAVCQGYALAYLDLMNRLGVPCEVVTSIEINHAWNFVKIGDSWYHVDVTWNDPSGWEGRVRHTYFQKSTNWFRTTGEHDAADWVYSAAAEDDEGVDTSYDDYFWNEVESPFCYYDGYWYGNHQKSIKKFRISDSGLEESGTEKAFDYRWYVWDSNKSYYTKNFSGLCILGNRLYYATPDRICALNLANGEEAVVFELSEEEKSQGRLYGFYVNWDGMLKYGLARDPNKAIPVKEQQVHDHQTDSWETVANTCTTDGKRSGVCTDCGFWQNQRIPAAGHTAGPAATCTAPQKCLVCQAELAKATGHTAGAAATCTEPQRCVTCQAELTKATGHTAGPAATCTEPQRCLVCQAELAKALGHTAGKGSCTEPVRCSRCQVVLQKAAGHLHTRTVTGKKATFVKKGTQKIVCKDCGKTIRTKAIAKIKCKKGDIYTVGGYRYQILSPKTNGRGTVAFAGLAKSTKKVVIKDSVTIQGARFQIVQIKDRALKNKASVTSVSIGKSVQSIGKEAFQGTKKLKTITIKSTRLSKVGANALKQTYSKVKIKVPKSKLSRYKSLLNKKGINTKRVTAF